MLEDGKGVTKETKRKRGKKAAEARDKTAKKQRGGGADSDNDNVFKPDDENETVASRNPLQRNSEFHPAKEDNSDGGSGADKENDAQVQATPTRLQDYSKERNMVTSDENKENEATNDGRGPQNDKAGEQMSSDHRACDGVWRSIMDSPCLPTVIGHRALPGTPITS
jgi:hypothetical protein